MACTIANYDDIIDSRDVIARIEELEDERAELVAAVEEFEDELANAIDSRNEAEDALNENESGDEAIDGLEAALDAAQDLVDCMNDELNEAIANLEDWDNDEDTGLELKALKKLAEDASDSPDWNYGETLIHEDYFVKYIEELIDDCYSLPKEMQSGDWPWRHITVDYDAAADEAKQDYFEVDYAGTTYYIRS